MSDQLNGWALVLGASSGFGEATSLALARAGLHIFGVHLDRKSTVANVERIVGEIQGLGRETHYFNMNAADEEKRREVLDQVEKILKERGEEGGVKVVLHSLAFGTLKPFITTNRADAISKSQMDMTVDVMAHSLVYWVQDLVSRRLMREGGRVFAMTSSGGQRVWHTYGAVSAAKAALEAAEAALVRAQMAVDHTSITAPFDGVVDARIAELGAYVKRGDPVAWVLDLDPILAVVMVSERDVGRISLGGPGHARLITGRKIDGQIRFIAAEAESETRTFRVEVELRNADGLVLDGMTTELRLPLERVRAHRVSPAILSLSDEGEIGVKVLGPENLIQFHRVQILDDGPDGIWLAGLPEKVTLITVGHEFVTEGQIVRPINAETLAPLNQPLKPEGAS